MNTDFSDIRNLVAYCFAHQDALLDEKAVVFVQQMMRLAEEKGAAFYVTLKQRNYLRFCKRKVLEKYPVEQAKSGLARMKQRKAELTRKGWKLGQRNLRRNDVTPATMPTVAISDVLEGYEVTARIKSNQGQQRAIADFIGTARTQKHGKKKGKSS